MSGIITDNMILDTFGMEEFKGASSVDYLIRQRAKNLIDEQKEHYQKWISNETMSHKLGQKLWLEIKVDESLNFTFIVVGFLFVAYDKPKNSRKKHYYLFRCFYVSNALLVRKNMSEDCIKDFFSFLADMKLDVDTPSGIFYDIGYHPYIYFDKWKSSVTLLDETFFKDTSFKLIQDGFVYFDKFLSKNS